MRLEVFPESCQKCHSTSLKYSRPELGVGLAECWTCGWTAFVFREVPTPHIPKWQKQPQARVPVDYSAAGREGAKARWEGRSKEEVAAHMAMMLRARGL